MAVFLAQVWEVLTRRIDAFLFAIPAAYFTVVALT